MRSGRLGTPLSAPPVQIGSSGSAAPRTSASGSDHKLRISRNKRSLFVSLTQAASLCANSPSRSGRLCSGTKRASASQAAGGAAVNSAAKARRAAAGNVPLIPPSRANKLGYQGYHGTARPHRHLRARPLPDGASSETRSMGI
jgi:hypothetical protein